MLMCVPSIEDPINMYCDQYDGYGDPYSEPQDICFAEEDKGTFCSGCVCLEKI